MGKGRIDREIGIHSTLDLRCTRTVRVNLPSVDFCNMSAWVLALLSSTAVAVPGSLGRKDKWAIVTDADAVRGGKKKRTSFF